MDIKWTIITAILGSGILSTLISHLLYTQKLKKEQLMKSENGIGRKMITALESAQELMEELNFIEIFEAEAVNEVFSEIESSLEDVEARKN